MSEAKVISVNPGIKTLGEMRVNNMSLVRLTRLVAPSKKMVSPFRLAVNALLGINARVNEQFSGKMMVMRLLFGTALILLSLCEINGIRIFENGTAMHPVLLMAVGVSLTIGLLARLSSLAGAGCIIYAVVTSAMAGALPDLFNASLALMMTVFAVFGPGRYCMDQFIRRGLYAAARKCRRRKKARSSSVTLYYRAYEMAGRNIS